MARSKKNAVTPKSETKKQKIMKGGNQNSDNPSIRKSGGSKKSSSKRKRKSRKESMVDADSVGSHQDQRSSGGTAGAASGTNRDAMREEVMTQVTVSPLDVGL